MAGNLKLNAQSGGSITLAPVDTAINYNISIPAKDGVLLLSDTANGATQLPTGTTAQRPVSPTTGLIRFNTTINGLEFYNSSTSAWENFSSVYYVDILLVAGGGAGYGTGGGAGGMVDLFGTQLTSGGIYNIIVGAGGAAGAGNSPGSNTSMSNTSISVAIGGGSGYDTSTTNGMPGGSGSGGMQPGSGNSPVYSSGGSGVAGQGYAGCYGMYYGDVGDFLRGGGGGAGGIGTATGGIGRESVITGTSVMYAGGGGGLTAQPVTAYAGGAGGGGASATSGSAWPGTTNSGGGGGANYSGTNGAGGSGIAIISYSSTFQKATGGTVTSYTSSGGSTTWVHKFTTSGTFTA